MGLSSTPAARRREPAVPLRMVEMVFPEATNHYGTMFGGKVLDLMDRAAFLVATRFCHQAIVTASMERIDFLVPIRQGHLVELMARVVHTGRTSLTARVDLFSEDPVGRTREHACVGYFHMVSVDASGHPIEVPELLLASAEEQAEWQKVDAMRQIRHLVRPDPQAHIS
jgi:acyl-CoA hydrolase